MQGKIMNSMAADDIQKTEHTYFCCIMKAVGLSYGKQYCE